MNSFALNEFEDASVIRHVERRLFDERPPHWYYSSSLDESLSVNSDDISTDDMSIDVSDADSADEAGEPAVEVGEPLTDEDYVDQHFAPAPNVLGLPLDLAVGGLICYQRDCALKFLRDPDEALEELLGPDLPLFLHSSSKLRQRLVLCFWRRLCGWEWEKIEQEYTSLQEDLPRSHNLPPFFKVRAAFSRFDILSPIRLLVCEKGSFAHLILSLRRLIFLLY